MYLGDQAAVHLVGVEAGTAKVSDVDLTLEHFAFSAQGLNEFEEKLERLDVPFCRADIPEINLVQINLRDPDGNHIHVDFKGDE